MDGIDNLCKNVEIPHIDEQANVICDVLWGSVPDTHQTIPLAFFFNCSKHAIFFKVQACMYVCAYVFFLCYQIK